jgi:hypothetical protein
MEMRPCAQLDGTPGRCEAECTSSIQLQMQFWFCAGGQARDSTHPKNAQIRQYTPKEGASALISGGAGRGDESSYVGRYAGARSHNCHGARRGPVGRRDSESSGIRFPAANGRPGFLKAKAFLRLSWICRRRGRRVRLPARAAPRRHAGNAACLCL